jgi:hypothetical protein
MVRIRSSNGYRFWITDDHHILPDRGEFTAYVPIITGNIPLPFSRSVSGDYEAMRRANHTDFVERFTAMETERLSLESKRKNLKNDLRTTKNSGPKRLWSKARKARFAEEKPKKIAELEKELKKTEESLKILAANKKSLKQKEFFSHQTHLYLSKLSKFAKYIEASPFWSAEIVQINVIRGANQAQNTSGNRWQEPEIELIPRAGDHIVRLGELDGNETERLEKLRIFYLNGLRYEGWHEFSTIDIRYKDQIICRKQ